MLTMKAYVKFGLKQDPFSGDVTKADDVFLTDETRFIAEFLYTTAKVGGMVALLGESGSGKTTIRRYAMDRIQSEGQKIKISEKMKALELLGKCLDLMEPPAELPDNKLEVCVKVAEE